MGTSPHPPPAGNSEIVRAVAHMREARCKFRVLGLSATPGADGSKVQARVGGHGRGGCTSACQQNWPCLIQGGRHDDTGLKACEQTAVHDANGGFAPILLPLHRRW